MAELTAYLDKFITPISNSKGSTNEINKDLLIVSLLEYICKKQNSKGDILFQKAISYLQSQNIIDKKVLDLDNFIDMKDNYVNILHELTENKTKMLELSCSNEKAPIYNSRYLNDFIEIEKISNGGFGIVYKTQHKLDGVFYAIKKIPLKNINVEENTKALNEAKILANLHHQNIIRYYSTWIEINNNNNIDMDSQSLDNLSNSDNYFLPYSSSNSNNQLALHNDFDQKYTSIIYIQMELCSMSLKEYLNTHNITDDKKYKIITDILNVIKYIHSQNVIHCDLSLKNILIDKNDNIKLCDFGLAEYLGTDAQYVIKSKNYGTLIYCASESLKDNKYSYKSDIYSLGIIIFEIINQFETEMERIDMINKFKNGECHCQYKDTILQMTNKDDQKRHLIYEL